MCLFLSHQLVQLALIIREENIEKIIQKTQETFHVDLFFSENFTFLFVVCGVDSLRLILFGCGTAGSILNKAKE